MRQFLRERKYYTWRIKNEKIKVSRLWITISRLWFGYGIIR